MSFTSAYDQVEAWHKQKKTIVLATGIFDLLHIEHIRFLKKAKEAGDKLVVGIETDERVKQIKGVARPVNTAAIRLEQLQALQVVDLAFLLPEQFAQQADWEQFMQSIKPDIYAVSSHTKYIDNKSDIAQKAGGELQIVHQFNPEYSSTKLHQKLIQEL